MPTLLQRLKQLISSKPEQKEVSRHGKVTLHGQQLYGNTPDDFLDQYGLGWYKKIADDPQVDAGLDILYSAVASCWHSASGYIPSAEEWAEVLEQIQHLPISYQTSILHATFDIHAAQIVPPKEPTPMEFKATDFARYTIDDFLGKNRHEDSDLNGRNFGQVVEQTLSAIEDGKSVQEIDWQLISDGPWKGKWGINDIWHRYPEFFDFDDNGKLWMRRYLDEYEATLSLPYNKLIIYSHRARYENYHGRSVLRSCSWPFDFSRNAESMNMISEERFGMPTPIGYLDEDSETTSTEMLTFLERLQRGASLVFNRTEKKKLEEIELLETQRRGGSSMYNVTIQRNKRLMSKVLLGSALALEEGETGSYSLAKATAAPNFRRKVQKLIKLVNWIHTTQTLSWLTFFNFPVGTRSPRLNMTLPSAEQIFQQEKEEQQQA